jgi:Ca2+-binding RTX toxin-like protein
VAIDGTGNELANAIVGNSSGNTLRGLAGNDTLTGNSGNDVLDGGADVDSMSGNAGNDTYIVDNAGDTIIETSTTEFDDRVESSVSYTLAAAARIETFVLTGTAAVNATGNSFTDTYHGNDANNVITAKQLRRSHSHGGNDTLIANGIQFHRLDGEASTRWGGVGSDYHVDNSGDVIVGRRSGFEKCSRRRAAPFLNLERLLLAERATSLVRAMTSTTTSGGNEAATRCPVSQASTTCMVARVMTPSMAATAMTSSTAPKADTIFGGGGDDEISDFAGPCSPPCLAAERMY